MKSRAAKNQDSGAVCWRKFSPPEKSKLVTPETREALAQLLTSDPERFIEACKEADVLSLREIPAYMTLLVTDPWQASEIAVLAEDAGILHRI